MGFKIRVLKGIFLVSLKFLMLILDSFFLYMFMSLVILFLSFGCLIKSVNVLLFKCWLLGDFWMLLIFKWIENLNVLFSFLIDLKFILLLSKFVSCL